jgi:hypothetical protein
MMAPGGGSLHSSCPATTTTRERLRALQRQAVVSKWTRARRSTHVRDIRWRKSSGTDAG